MVIGLIELMGLAEVIGVPEDIAENLASNHSEIFRLVSFRGRKSER